MKIQFAVSPENIIEFSDLLYDNDLTNQIAGTDDGNLLVEVSIDKGNRDLIDELEDLSEND